MNEKAIAATDADDHWHLYFLLGFLAGFVSLALFVAFLLMVNSYL